MSKTIVEVETDGGNIKFPTEYPAWPNGPTDLESYELDHLLENACEKDTIMRLKLLAKKRLFETYLAHHSTASRVTTVILTTLSVIITSANFVNILEKTLKQENPTVAAIYIMIVAVSFFALGAFAFWVWTKTKKK